MKVSLVWVTPNAQDHLVHMARVSNPKSQAAGANPSKLIGYLIEHGHWSPFEMVSACFEIETTRDISRQILRHRSFSFQEFSQRYGDVSVMPANEPREARLQDVNNRQSSLPVDDADLQSWWHEAQLRVAHMARSAYEQALSRGIAKEVARVVLPEGLTTSRLYMAGTLRSWLHYLAVRCEEGVQAEHRLVADAIRAKMHAIFPRVMQAAHDHGVVP